MNEIHMEAQLGLDYTAVFTVLSELVEIGLVVVNPSGEMDFASGRARTMLGCGDDLTVTACHPEVRKAVAEVISEVRGGNIRSVQRQIRFKEGGKERDLIIDAHPIDEKDCTGVLILVKDAANMQKMVQDLRMSAQFRNTRRLYHAVVHNLRQPISAVLVHLDLIRERIDTDNEENAKSNPALNSVRVIKNQMAELNRTLTLLLEEIQPSTAEERGFSLRDVLEDVIRLIEPQAARQDVDVYTSIGDHAARMSGSRQRVKQALLNLAVNALDAMNDGGELRIEMNVAEKVAEISVRDGGPGIEASVLPHIFEMHFTTKAAGTGVGLYVARDVIERHGGRLDVETEEGRGSLFRAVLPVSENGS